MTSHFPPASEEQLWSWVDRSAPELDAHLERHPEDRPRVAELRAMIEALTPGAPLPERLGGCRLGRRVGAGGMGVVFEAEQEAPRRRVAVKVLRSEGVLSPGAGERLRREGEVLAALDHPGLATVHAAGVEAGYPYLVMEFVEGLPLEEFAEARGLGRRGRIDLVRRVAEAVAHAHAAGVVHRDLKSQNVLVREDGQPKVLDFGLARRLDGGRDATLTRTGALVGTLTAMAPEQFGDGEVGPQADVFALGVLLYRLLLGRHPYGVEDASLADALKRMTNGAPRRPRALDRSFPTDLEAVLLRALEPRPAARYRDAGEFADELGRFLASEAVHARPDTVRRRAWRLVRRRPAVAVVLGVSVVAAGLGVVLTWKLNPTAFRWALAPIGLDRARESPFRAVRFAGTRPEALIDGTWYEVEAIDGVRVALLLEEMRAAGRDWKKRFTEDLGPTLLAAGRLLGDEVELDVREVGNGVRLRLVDVPLSGENRRACWYYRNALLEQRVAFREGRPVLERAPGAAKAVTDGMEIEEIGGLDVDVLLDAIEDRPRELARLAVLLLTQFASHRAGDTIDVVGRAPGEAATRTVAVPADAAAPEDADRPRVELRALFEAARR